MTRVMMSACAALLLGWVYPAASAELRIKERTCFERTYDAAHLAAQPGQRVRRIRLSAEPGPAGAVTAGLDVWLRNDRERYAAYATCRSERGAMRCRSEFDDRTWLVRAKGPDRVLITNGDIWLNPWAYDSEDRSSRGLRLRAAPQDRTWLLGPAKCPGNPND